MQSVEEIIKQQILGSPELADIIDQRAEQKYLALNLSQRLTREQLSRMYQVSKDSIDRLSEEELKSLGFVKLKIGTSVRFERIGMAKASREIFRLIRKGQ